MSSSPIENSAMGSRWHGCWATDEGSEGLPANSLCRVSRTSLSDAHDDPALVERLVATVDRIDVVHRLDLRSSATRKLIQDLPEGMQRLFSQAASDPEAKADLTRRIQFLKFHAQRLIEQM